MKKFKLGQRMPEIENEEAEGSDEPKPPIV